MISEDVRLHLLADVILLSLFAEDNWLDAANAFAISTHSVYGTIQGSQVVFALIASKDLTISIKDLAAFVHYISSLSLLSLVQ